MDKKRFESLKEADSWMFQHVDDGCIDNVRHARKDNAAEVAAYDEARATGCCGSFDSEVVIAGVEMLIGCNYGH